MFAVTDTAQIVQGESVKGTVIALLLVPVCLLALAVIKFATAYINSKEAKQKTEKAEAEAKQIQAEAEKLKAEVEKVKIEAEKAKVEASLAKDARDTLIKGIEAMPAESQRKTKDFIKVFSGEVGKFDLIDSAVKSLGLKNLSKVEIQSPKET